MAGSPKTLDATKGNFFDRGAVQAAMDEGARKALNRSGALVRLFARRSIRKRQAASDPGTPPSSHSGLLRNGIYYAWDPGPRSVVVGPTAFNQQDRGEDGRPEKGTVPGVLERGGAVHILEARKWGAWVRADQRSKRRLEGLPTRVRTVRVGERPYMVPAVAGVGNKFPEAFRDAMRATSGGS